MKYRPRKTLLTGVTGVVGSAILRELLRDPDGQIAVLVRPGPSTQPYQRLAEVFAFLGIDPEGPFAIRVELVAGNLYERHFGLNADEYEGLLNSTTDIIHAAGNVKLNQPLEIARRDAVISTQRVIEFAEGCREKGPFGKCEFISTVGVCGRWKDTFPETTELKPRDFHNTYEEAKAESEVLVLKAMNAGLSATIHRPSMVVGDSMTGRIMHFQVFYFLAELLLGKRLWGILPDFGDFRLDIIPVDYVAKAIVLSNRCLETNGRVLHLCSGRDGAVRMSEMASRIRNMAEGRGQRLTNIKTIQSRSFWRNVSMIGAWLPGKAGRVAATLPFFLSYLDDHQSFDNANTKAFVLSKGLSIPTVDSYFEQVLNYYFSMRFRNGQHR